MSNKEKYVKFCENYEDMNIFSQYWWLDTVVGENSWDVLLVEKGGSVQGVLPFYYKNNGKYKSISQPVLTPRNGVILNYPKNQKITKRISFERKVVRELIEKLESLQLDSYIQNFQYEYKNWLPFYWKGFNQTTRISYIIPKGLTEKEVFDSIDPTTRNLIRKAEKYVVIDYSTNVEEFYKVCSMTFTRKGMTIPYSFEVVKKLDQICEEKKCKQIIVAKDSDGNIHSAVYLVWDKNYVYYIMGGINPEFKESSSKSLVLYNAIKFAVDKGLNFDFEGSMNEDIEKFFSSFGGNPIEFYTISKRYKLNLNSILQFFVFNSTRIREISKKFKRR